MTIRQATGLAIAGQLQDILLKQGRSIAAIIPQVVLEEQHTDDLMITSHPVESGGNITDHSVKQPVSLLMKCGWSKSGSLTALGIGGTTPEDAYEQLQDLQNSRIPFSVVSGKRTYQNMLIRRLTTVTDVETENSLIIDVELQEVILVNSDESGGTVGVGDDQANPATTAPPVNTGTKQLTNVTSLISSQQMQAIQTITQ